MDAEAISQVLAILRSQFSALSSKEIINIPNQLRNPLKYKLRTILFVADDLKNKVKGFALLNHAPDIDFCYLDYISAAPGRTSAGIGSALYERVREEAAALSNNGLFYECLPDDAALCKDTTLLRENRARLRFYERYGAYPIINTKYETPLKPTDDCAPYLVYDALGRQKPLPLEQAQHIVRTILIRKYGRACPAGYVDMVVGSFRDDPVRVRGPKYVKNSDDFPVRPVYSVEKRIAMAVNDKHDIHHVREKGYVESPVRISSILKGIDATGLFDRLPVHHYPEKKIKAVHNGNFIEYLKKMCSRLEPGRSIYPYVFPIRNAARPPKELPVRAGYYCIDTFTPLNRNAYIAAKRAVDCALTAADAIITGGYRIAYALVRPPGHHAEYRTFGGFCYFNSGAAAAHHLSGLGKVAVLDIDYHHGNGTQDIFYRRADVLTISIHGHPSFAYPYFSGFADERGTGAGLGFNRNYALAEQVKGDQYLPVLAKALKRIVKFRPKFLVLALGYDIAQKDPTGTWDLRPADFERVGNMIGHMSLPTLVVQEGGYRTSSLYLNAGAFFTGLWNGFQSPRARYHLDENMI